MEYKYTKNCWLILTILLCMKIRETGADTKCEYIRGTCQYDNIGLPCPGGYKTNLCDGGRHRRCCLPYDDRRCSARNGRCQEDGLSCPGGYQSGLCAGPVHRRCCLPYPDRYCLFRGGRCGFFCLTGARVAGLCNGHSLRRCCLEDTAVLT